MVFYLYLDRKGGELLLKYFKHFGATETGGGPTRFHALLFGKFGKIVYWSSSTKNSALTVDSAIHKAKSSLQTMKLELEVPHYFQGTPAILFIKPRDSMPPVGTVF